ncbi:MAG: hypothetical protein IJ737_04160 [Ruminococcus sp.]|nr:hypothetical protein [Ruminococcus sp.]
MINMIKAELYRMTKTKGFYIFWICVIITFLISVLYHEPGGISLGAPLEYSGDIKMDIQQTAMNFSYYFYLIIPVFSVIAGEFTEHTVKNTISSAITRSKYFIAKFFFTLFYSILALTAGNYLFYFCNRAVNGTKYSSSIGDFSKAFFGQLPLFVGLVSLFIFLAFLLRKGAAFNAVTIITPIAYTSIALVFYGISGTKSFAEKLLTYEVSTMMSKLALDCSDSYRIKCYILSGVLTVLSFGLGYLQFNKRELE